MKMTPLTSSISSMAFAISMMALSYLAMSYYYTMYRRNHPARNDDILSILDELFLIDIAQENHEFYYQMLEWMMYGMALGLFMASILPRKEDTTGLSTNNDLAQVLELPSLQACGISSEKLSIAANTGTKIVIEVCTNCAN